MSAVSFDTLAAVNNKWICFLIAGLKTLKKIFIFL